LSRALYIAAYFGGQYYFFTANGWTMEIQAYQSGITTVPNAVTLASGDLSGLVGTALLLGYGNGSGASALNDMLQAQKYAQIHTIASTAGAGTTNLQDLSLWNIYGSGQMQGAAMEFGDAICGDFKLEWNNQTVTSYFNGNKIGGVAYASGYGEPFALAFRTFVNPIKVNSITVTQP